MLGPQRILGDDKRWLCVDDSDPSLSGCCTRGVGCIVAIVGDEPGLVETCFCIDPGLLLCVLALNGGVLAVLLGKYPFKAVDFIHKVRKDADHVYGVVYGDRQGVGDGVCFAYGCIRHGISECLYIRNGFLKYEYAGVIVFKVHVFLDGRFPGTSEKGDHENDAKGK